MGALQPTSLLDINADDVQDIITHPDGSEVQLRISKAELVEKKKKPGEFQLALMLDDPSDDLVDDIYKYVQLPDPATKDNKPKAYAKTHGALIKFYTCFDIDTTPPIDTANMEGCTGWCILGLELDNNGVERNFIKKYVTRR